MQNMPYQLRSCFGKGWEAHREGLKREENPYDELDDPLLHEQWDEGWRKYKETRSGTDRYPKVKP